MVCVAFRGNSSRSYGKTPAIWDHTVFVTCHPAQVKTLHPPTRDSQPVLNICILRGMEKIDLKNTDPKS